MERLHSDNCQSNGCELFTFGWLQRVKGTTYGLLQYKNLNHEYQTYCISHIRNRCILYCSSLRQCQDQNLENEAKYIYNKLDVNGELPYKGFFNCFAKSIKNEGVLGLWVGLPTFYSRIAPHAMITVLLQDFFHDLLSPQKH